MSTAVAALLSTGESHILEFKASFNKAAIESLVAFANARGGKVLVGVSDTGKIIGTTVGKETLNEWLGQIKSATSPALIPEIALHDVEGKQIVEIHIQEFPVKPVSTFAKEPLRHNIHIGRFKTPREVLINLGTVIPAQAGIHDHQQTGFPPTRERRINLCLPSTIIDDRQFTDTLFEVVEQSMKFIISHIAVAFQFDGSVQRKERFAYPRPPSVKR